MYLQYQNKYFKSGELGVLSTMVNSNLGSIDTGAGDAFREGQKHDFHQSPDTGPSFS